MEQTITPDLIHQSISDLEMAARTKLGQRQDMAAITRQIARNITERNAPEFLQLFAEDVVAPSMIQPFVKEAEAHVGAQIAQILAQLRKNDAIVLFSSGLKITDNIDLIARKILLEKMVPDWLRLTQGIDKHLAGSEAFKFSWGQEENKNFPGLILYEFNYWGNPKPKDKNPKIYTETNFVLAKSTQSYQEVNSPLENAWAHKIGL